MVPDLCIATVLALNFEFNVCVIFDFVSFMRVVLGSKYKRFRNLFTPKAMNGSMRKQCITHFVCDEHLEGRLERKS